MQWSRFNTLFHSDRFGYFLYNALSNTLMELDEAHYQTLEKVQKDEFNFDLSRENDLVTLLCKNRILLDNGEEQQLLLSRHYRRQSLCFDTSLLNLTICPTLQCNFRCPYCFEQSQQASCVMASETIERLLYFIRSYQDIRHLSIAWYGGEPLLAFDVIQEVMEKIDSLNLTLEGAGLITNGYLLDSEKAKQLNKLRINSIQITLDGPEEVHDTRRTLAGGKPTFQRILQNIDTLMSSSYEGACSIRVNVDKHNHDRFIELRAALLNQFKGKKLFVYAAHVNSGIGHSYDHSCTLNLQEWMEFSMNMHRQSGQPAGGFYPGGNLDSICIANTHQGFVVGPEGELYKCWENVGRPEMIIGSIYLDNPITNPELQALYCIGSDAYSDPECRECNVLPICGGGCANKRLRRKLFGEEGVEFCSPYRTKLISCLEAYIDTFRRSAICNALLTPGIVTEKLQGYRMISPKGLGKY
jgi:uncharacterized protein